MLGEPARAREYWDSHEGDYRTWLDESPLAGRAIAVSVVDFCPVAGQDGWALLLPLVTLIGCGCVCLPCAWALPGGVAEEY